jgi:hypothetical protein
MTYLQRPFAEFLPRFHKASLSEREEKRQDRLQFRAHDGGDSMTGDDFK